jgi:hypothetical protein
MDQEIDHVTQNQDCWVAYLTACWIESASSSRDGESSPISGLSHIDWRFLEPRLTIWDNPPSSYANKLWREMLQKKRAPRDVPQALKGLREIWRPARLMAMLSRYSICVWLCSSIRTLIRYILCVRLVWWFRGIQFQGNCLSDRSEVALFQRNFLKMGFKNIYW